MLKKIKENKVDLERNRGAYVFNVKVKKAMNNVRQDKDTEKETCTRGVRIHANPDVIEHPQGLKGSKFVALMDEGDDNEEPGSHRLGNELSCKPGCYDLKRHVPLAARTC